MTRYLIDIRLMGPVRSRIRTLAGRLQEKFGLKNRLVAPHITLAGPFSTVDEARLVEDFARICTDVTAVPRYEAGGYGFFEDSRAVFVTITPDENLKQFRYRLYRALEPYCMLRDYDRVPAGEFRFHATLAMKLDLLTFVRIRWYFRNEEAVTCRYHPIRATLLKNSKILCEYDFIQQRMLTRAQVLSKATRNRDLKILRLWDEEEKEGRRQGP